MPDLLDEQLNIRVNDYLIVLNEKLNVEELDKHDIKKIGFFGRLMIRSDKGETVFWSKNSTLKFIDNDDENAIMPILDNVEARRVYKTSAYLSFRNDVLVKFTFQVIGNPNSAKLILEKFEEKIIKHIGKPSSFNQPFNNWEERNQKLIVEFSGTRTYGHIHLMTDR